MYSKSEGCETFTSTAVIFLLKFRVFFEKLGQNLSPSAFFDGEWRHPATWGGILDTSKDNRKRKAWIFASKWKKDSSEAKVWLIWDVSDECASERLHLCQWLPYVDNRMPFRDHRENVCELSKPFCLVMGSILSIVLKMDIQSNVNQCQEFSVNQPWAPHRYTHVVAAWAMLKHGRVHSLAIPSKVRKHCLAFWPPPFGGYKSAEGHNV